MTAPSAASASLNRMLSALAISGASASRRATRVGEPFEIFAKTENRAQWGLCEIETPGRDEQSGVSRFLLRLLRRKVE
jgi:hypothetical protein